MEKRHLSGWYGLSCAAIKARSLSIAISLSFCMHASSVFAQELELANDAAFAAVSGYAGVSHTLGTSDGTRSISAIEWYEDSDEPCKLILDNENLNTNALSRPQLVLDGTYDHVGKQPCSSPGNKKRVAFSGTDNWIYKVQVCTTDKRNTSDDKLKGIRIWPATVNQSSPLSITRGASYQEAKHVNCAQWHAAVACPTGKIAARLRVHHDAAEEKIIGLALECRTLAVN